MSKIERMRVVVPLYKGRYQVKLDDLVNRAAAALRAETTAGPLRVGQGKPESMKLADEHDKVLAEAEADAIFVTVYALPYDVSQKLIDAHPPREDNEEDTNRGVNMATFLDPLLKASLAADDTVGYGADADTLVKQGAVILAELSPTRVQYEKLKTAAWNANNGDDAVGKSSLVSRLMALRDSDSKQPSEPE